jgi:hypothetical protein
MRDQWQYQVRIDLSDELAELARRDLANPALDPLPAILARHNASMRSQFDAFADYVADAERQGGEHYPLYKWTKTTIGNPAKKAKISSLSRSMSTATKSTPKTRLTPWRQT